METLDFAIKYPFSEEAKKTIEDLTLTDEILALAVERIKKSLEGKNSPKIIFKENEKKEEICSYAAARMILGYLRNTYITSKFAVNESKIARNYLDKEKPEIFRRIAARFGISYLERNGKKMLDLPAYLKYSIRSPHYKLINRRLTRGLVEIDDKDLKRLVEEAIKKHTEDIPPVKEVPSSIKKAAEEVIASLPKKEIVLDVKEGDHPPCIMNMLESAKKHQNIPHHARWYLATYLIAIGMREERILSIYATLPDYNEKTTAYQLKHIKLKRYNVPSCATVMSYGLCCAPCRIGHPLRWHKLEEHKKRGLRE